MDSYQSDNASTTPSSSSASIRGDQGYDHLKNEPEDDDINDLIDAEVPPLEQMNSSSSSSSNSNSNNASPSSAATNLAGGSSSSSSNVRVDPIDLSPVSSGFHRPAPTHSHTNTTTTIIMKSPTTIAAPDHIMMADLKVVQQQSETIVLFPSRWFALFNFSMLAIMNNVVCFSLAPVVDQAEKFYDSFMDLSYLIDLFFLTYVLASFPSSRYLQKHGLRAGLVLGCLFQSTGAVLRCLTLSGVEGSSFLMVMIGQAVASLGQAFVVNSPPMVAADFFGENERTIATTIACNADVLGVAVTYILSPAIVNRIHDVPNLMKVVAVCSVAVAAMTIFFFPNEPINPPSRSASQKRSQPKPPPETVKSTFRLFNRKGFGFTVAAFAIGEATVNGFSTFMNNMLVPGGFTQSFVSIMGSMFVVSGMIGAGILSTLVDKWRNYKSMLLLSFACAAASLCYFSILMMQSDPSSQPFQVVLAILLSGFFINPLLPLGIECGVESAFPAPESSTTAVQQVVGNIASTGLIPLLTLLKGSNGNFVVPNWVLTGLVAVVGVGFIFFSGRYLRLLSEQMYEASEGGARDHAPSSTALVSDNNNNAATATSQLLTSEQLANLYQVDTSTVLQPSSTIHST
eukprot:TRINITY_DN2215_c0_g1_i1.p1 TRINITY_DN2215_c0_g1~~TRINITY_DN2215_c0_g1_i1.p1  ORF type:complete len:627 (-),score=166.04 TRINITY_DN2215_c0_g1_i1:326-2206(-)